MSRKKSTFDEAKIPPHEKEIEEAVLGAIMLEKSAFELVSDILSPECFYIPGHESVYRACVKLASVNQPIDLLTVVEQMQKDGQITINFSAAEVSKLSNHVIRATNIEAHAHALLRLYQRRKLIRMCADDAAKAYDPEHDIFHTLQDHDQSLTALMNSGPNKNMSAVEDVAMEAIDHIHQLRKKDSHITGIPSGFSELDRITHGWQDNNLIVIAARPAMGKTAFALRLMRHAAENNHKSVCAGFFSLEMSKQQLMNRLLASESGVHLGAIMSGRITHNEMESLTTAAAELSGLKIFIDDTPALGIMELKSKIRRLHRKHKIGVAFIDYLQLMTDSSKNNREQEISSVSRNLKAIAKELNIPIIALCQLSREVEKRSDKTPQLSDLRESGAIEQDADMVMFMYRPEYYSVSSDEMGESTSGLCEIKIAKNRHGALDTIRLRADLTIQKFFDWTGTDNSHPRQQFIPVKMAFQTDENPF